jgi:signal transduction histidine kinase
MSGAILLGFNTKGIQASKARIRNASVLVSGIVLLIGILMGFWLSRQISVPVLALRDASRRVGEGDLNQRINRIRRDEIGQLERAFNKMVGDLQKTRHALNEKNEVLQATNSTLNDTLEELKRTHAQLVQSEKMASLGELTAGIAHEIQNPLNFVNNFSEVSMELIGEILDERAKPEPSATRGSNPNCSRTFPATSKRSRTTANAPTGSSKACCCIPGAAQGKRNLRTSTRFAMNSSGCPITGCVPRTSPSTRPPKRISILKTLWPM